MVIVQVSACSSGAIAVSFHILHKNFDYEASHGLIITLFSHACLVVCRSHPHGSPVKPQLSLHWLREPAEVTREEDDALALNFSQLGCASSRLVGGKGCQLALLTQLKSHVRTQSTFSLDSSFLYCCCVVNVVLLKEL